MLLRRYMLTNQNKLQGHENHYVVWGGDFNQHHPMWDRDKDTCLFTTKAFEEAGMLINLEMELNMYIALTKRYPHAQTHGHETILQARQCFLHE
jgi:hypothetical protein